MADAVRELLEQQIPELHDLVASGIFSDAEVKRIVAKRRKFECVIQLPSHPSFGLCLVGWHCGVVGCNYHIPHRIKPIVVHVDWLFDMPEIVVRDAFVCIPFLSVPLNGEDPKAKYAKQILTHIQSHRIYKPTICENN